MIIAGSGPTDRDGNSALEPGKIDTLKDFANVLASSGVASLRYDKLGTGATGLASYASHPDDIGFDVFVNEATAAYNYLRGRPEVDPQRIMILGHSEGALIAMVMTDSLAGSEAPRALVLAAPPGNAYLETIEQQLRVQYAAAVHTGHANQQQADAALADVDRIVTSLKAQGTYPPGMTIAEPALQSIFSGANQRFLAEVERYDPATLAAKLPAQLPILVLHGGKDQQISRRRYRETCGRTRPVVACQRPHGGAPRRGPCVQGCARHAGRDHRLHEPATFLLVRRRPETPELREVRAHWPQRTVMCRRSIRRHIR